jgi:hypothetical protein
METTKLTVRLRDERLYGLLKLLAAQRGVSMNQMVEDALARELEREADRAEGELTETLELLRSYRAEPATLAREFADAEVTEPDPLRSEPAGDAPSAEAIDPLGALAGFDQAA